MMLDAQQTTGRRPLRELGPRNLWIKLCEHDSLTTQVHPPYHYYYSYYY